MTKKKIAIYTIITIVAIVAIATGTVFIFKVIKDGSSNTQDSAQKIISETKTAADNLKSQALQATEINSVAQTDKSTALLQEAKLKYTEINDTNNLVDIESLLHQNEQNRKDQVIGESNTNFVDTETVYTGM